MITKLTLSNYRSYANHNFELHPVATVVVGPNATGKTNLLESLYVLANTKSFRVKDQELIKHGSDHFRIEATTPTAKIGLGFSTQPRLTKQIDYDRVKRPLIRHIGTMPTVLFEPEDLQLLTGSPSLRRRYIDGILAQTSPDYRQALANYQRVLKQRNSLLERFDITAVKDQVFAWDLNLTTQAAAIVSARLALLGRLNQTASQLYRDVAGQAATLTFSYVPTIEFTNDYAEAFMTALVTNLPRDLGAGFTTIGPHREDFGLSFNGSNVAAVASRGEVRSVILALKLAELELLTRDGATPLLLLDDVFSELDASRRQYLIGRLGDYQSVITTTDADIAQLIGLDHAVIKTMELARYGAN